MSYEKILGNWKKKLFNPVYWLEGEEPFYIDQLIVYAETKILSEAEASFNLSVFYGKDALWPEVINACRKYPMFGEKQVVILKEAQQMRELDKLEAYIASPLPSTIFIVAHKEKKVDGRGKLAKLLKQNAEIFSTKKMYDNQLGEWANNMVISKGYTIKPKALQLLVDHIGNDISRINNEIEKVLVNLNNRTEINEVDIETYVGVSKDFNVFELQDALVRKDTGKAIRIIQYFGANPKAGPIQMILPALYNFFSKVYMVFGAGNADDKSLASAIGVHPFFLKDYKTAASKYGYEGTERVLLLLHSYNLRSVGVNDAGTEDASLMKEFIAKALA